MPSRPEGRLSGQNADRACSLRLMNTL